MRFVRVFSSLGVLVAISIVLGSSYLRNSNRLTVRQDTSIQVYSNVRQRKPATNAVCSQAARKARIREVCENYNPENQTNPDDPRTYSRLLVDDQHKVIYCVIPKNACSTWKAVMAIQTGRVSLDYVSNHQEGVLHNFPNLEKQTGLYLLNTVGDMEGIRYRLQNYHTFLVARNPYTRLYSGYTDKFINNTRSKMHKDQILNMFPEAPVYGAHAFMTFPQFLTVVTRTTKNVSHNSALKFQSDLLRDVHYRTQLSHCHPCVIDYDYITRLETMDTDRGPLMTLFNISSLPTLNKVTKDLSMVDSLEDGLSQVSDETIKELLHIYKFDFELFGYSPAYADKGEHCDGT